MITTTKTKLLLIKDNYNRISILGEPKEITDPSWLAMQRKPFAKDAILHSAYPLSGGVALVDINDTEVIRKVTQKDIDSSTTNSGSFNPASGIILKLWESPPQLPEFILAQIPN